VKKKKSVIPKQVRLEDDVYKRASEVKRTLPPKRSLGDIFNDAARIGLEKMIEKKTSYVIENL
jgi:hypothetical protein